jgi:hypothetical protein
MYLDRRPFGSPITAETRRVEDNRDDARDPNEKTVIIFTDHDNIHLKFGKKTVELCAKSGVKAEHLKVSGAELPKVIATLREAGRIGDGTQIIIDMHGALRKNENQESRHFLDASVETCDVVSAVRKPLKGKACSANIYILSCESGDQGLRDSLKDLHKESEGACFLLSSKKKVLTGPGQAELTNMLSLFCYAEENGQAPPPPHIILTRMLSRQTDCISMVDRDGLIIRHAPIDESQFGLAGVIADIDDRLRAKTQPSTQPPDEEKGGSGDAPQSKGDAKTSDASEKPPESGNAANPKLDANTVSATRLRQAASTLSNIPDFMDSNTDIGEQREQVLFRRLWRTSDPEIVETLFADQKFTDLYEAKKWNESHDSLSSLISDIFQLNKKIDKKMERLISLMIDKKEAFGELDINLQRRLLGSWDDSLVAYLHQGNFFSHAPLWITVWLAKRENIIEFGDRVEALRKGLAGGDFESLQTYFLLFNAAAEDETGWSKEKLRYLCSAAPENIGASIGIFDMPKLLSLLPQYGSNEDLELASNKIAPPLSQLHAQFIPYSLRRSACWTSKCCLHPKVSRTGNDSLVQMG